MKHRLLALFSDEAGLTMVEYAVGGGLIIAVCIGAIASLGGGVAGLFTVLSAAP